MPTLQELRARLPQISNLSDDDALTFIHRAYYPGRTVDELGSALGVVREQPVEKSSLMWRAVGDTGVSLLKGAIGVPEAAVGVADIVSGGQAGKLAEDAGFRPKEAKAVLDDLYSPEQQAANRKVQQAQGFFDTAAAAVQNPSTILQAAIESAPSLLPAGAVARGVMAAAPRLGGAIAAGIGEGVVSAGQTAEQVRQESANGELTGEQAALSAGSGALTGLIGAAAGKVANRLGIGDINQLVAGVQNAEPAVQKGVIRSLMEGFATEGILQELPQSAQEQIAQNVALGKPWDEGVGNAAAMGAMAGGLMGGAAAPFGHSAPRAPTPEEHAQEAQQRLASATNVSDMITAANDLASVPLDLPTPTAAAAPATPEPAQPAPFDRFSFGSREAADEYLAKLGADWVPAQKSDGSWSFVMSDQAEGGPATEPGGTAQRVAQLRQQLADPAARERVRSQLGDEALQTLLYYAQAANRKDIPAKTSERMVGLAEMILDRSVLQPIRQPAGMQSSEFGNEALAAPAAVQQIPLDTAPTGVMRVDSAGSAAPETRADAINTRQAQAQRDEAAAVDTTLGQPGRRASAVWADPKVRTPAPPLNMPERRNTDGVELAPVAAEPSDPVAAFIDRLRTVATPQARAFVQDFNAGRITRREVIRVMQSQGQDPLSPDERIQQAAAQAPAPATGIQPEKVYRSRSAAFVQARKVGGMVEPSGNGFVVREQADGQRDMALPAGTSVQADAARSNLADGSSRDVGLRADDAGGRVLPSPGAPVAGRAGGIPAGLGSNRKGPLNAQATRTEGTEAPAAARQAAATAPAAVSDTRGAGDVQATGLSPVDVAVKEAPIARYRREAQQIESTLPPVADGMVRMWRGNRPGEVGKNPQFTNSLPGIALPFRDAYKGELSYVDVPQDVADAGVQIGAVATNAEFRLPPEYAARAKTVRVGASVDEGANQAATSPTNPQPEPTQAQKEAGNYKVGRVRIAGMDISIENPQGSVRSGVDEDGKAWSNTLQHHYGYIRRTEGADGDHVDVFVKPGTPADHGGPVYVVDQVNPKTGKFDEHKALIGFDSEQEAREAYQANYANDWTGLKSIREMSPTEFKAWVGDKANTQAPASEPRKPPTKAEIDRKKNLTALKRREFVLNSLRKCIG